MATLYPADRADLHADGDEPRPHWADLAGLLGVLGPAELHRRQHAAGRLATSLGAAQLAGAAEVPLLDPVPFVISQRDWATLRAGIVQRVLLHNRLLDDLYGERRLIADGTLSARQSLSQPQFIAAASGWQPIGPRLTRYSADVAPLADGTYRIVAEHTDVPSGEGMALLVRAAVARTSPDLYGGPIEPLGPFFVALRRSIVRHAAGSGVRVAVLAEPALPGYVEHAFMATQLGYHIVNPADLAVRGGRVWLRALGGLEPIDVILRAIPSSATDPLETGVTTAGVAGLVEAARERSVVMANAIGSGIGEQLTDQLSRLCEVVLGERLLLTTRAAGDPPPATTPTLVAGGDLRPATATLTLHATFDGERVMVMRGGVASALHDNTTTWKAVVVGAYGHRSLPPLTASSQIDLTSSLPTRAAEALFWLGRNAERAELTARTMNAVHTAAADDPALLEGGWAVAMRHLVDATSSEYVAPRLSVTLHAALDRAGSADPGALAHSLGHLVRGAATVREFLSGATWRVMATLHAELESMHAQSGGGNPTMAVETTERVLAALAAFAGLSQESIVRGPSWRLLDVGRRIERALLVVRGLRSAWTPPPDDSLVGPIGETILASNETLVAYRRRYRTDVDAALLLRSLLDDEANPRAVRFQVDRLREHLSQLGDLTDLTVAQASLGRVTTTLNNLAVMNAAGVVDELGALLNEFVDLEQSLRAAWFTSARERRL